MISITKPWQEKLILFSFLCSIVFVSCDRDISEAKPVANSKNPEVFIDGFSPGLNYAAFGGSVPTAFDVDTEVTYDRSSASMKFAVPDFNDPRGSYAGGAFFTSVGRDLSSFNCLTFWARATQAANLDVIGFGNDFGASPYVVTVNGLAINTNWQKYIIPIPDPSKLVDEKGMFYYSEGPENGRGYTFWIDEVKFENLGTVTPAEGIIIGGETRQVNAEEGERLNLNPLQARANMPNGTNFSVAASPNYFTFMSSNPEVASVDASGNILVKVAGEAEITAMLGGKDAVGKLTVRSVGQGDRPAEPAPTPTREAANVISMFSNAYTNVPIDTWNTRWEFSTAEEDFTQVQGNDVIRYRNLNFVGIEFSSSQINASEMTHFHLNVWTPDAVSAAKSFKVLLVDFGANGTFGGGDDSSHELSFTVPTVQSKNWFSINVPLTNFTGLTNRRNLAQLVLSGDYPNVWIDNVYFYKTSGGGGGTPTAPTVAAPTPTHPAADVISIFSNAYTNVAGVNLNPFWGQATQVSEVNIAGNNTLRYRNLNYQGIEIGSNIDASGMQFLHIDYWTSTSTALSVFAISPGPVERPFVLTVPTTGWRSIDIPLSQFSPVDLRNVFQFKFEGNGEIYIDNIYFRK